MASKYIKGDIHEEILKLEDNSIDLIYTNPPYGTTSAKWDKPLKWKELFPEMWRVLKPDGFIILHCAKPFTYKLIGIQAPKYHYSWKKNISTNYYHAKRQPLREMEEVLVYYKKNGTYNPQMRGNKILKTCKANNTGQCYYGARKHRLKKGHHVGYYPTDFLEYKIDIRGGKTVPDEMIEYFIKTYTNEDETVLDMTTHNNVVGNVVTKLKRNFIGIDLNLDTGALEKKI